MKHLKQLILTGVVAAGTLAALAPLAAAASDDTGGRQRACHWDRQTGRMICRRVRHPSGDPAPAPSPAPVPPKTGAP